MRNAFNTKHKTAKKFKVISKILSLYIYIYIYIYILSRGLH